MFDMQKIGRKISALRKAQGLTQMELADKLGISFQAVSNWERGNTMPDISKLPDLAEIFSVSIEEILGDERKGKLVTEIAKGETKEIRPAELAEIAPILKEEQVQKAVEQTDSSAFDLQSLIELAPYMDEEELDEIADCIQAERAISKALSNSPPL